MSEFDGAAGVANDTVRVVFFTNNFRTSSVPDTTFTVPGRVLPAGLCELINSLLELDPPTAFNFFIERELVTKSLDKFLKEHSDTHSREDVLHIEFSPSLQYTVQQRLPHDDWVSALRTPTEGCGVYLTGCYDNSIRLWHAGDSNDGDVLASGQQHRGAVKDVCFLSTPSISVTPAAGRSANGSSKKRLLRPSLSDFGCASASKDGSVVVWSYNSKTEGFEAVRSIVVHTQSVESLDYDSGTNRMITASWDGTMCVVDPTTHATANDDGVVHHPIARYKGHTTHPVLRCRFLSPSKAISTGLDGNVKTWDVASLTSEPLHTLHSGHAAYGLATLKGGAACATGHTDAKVRLWDLRTYQVTHRLQGHKQWVYNVAYCGEYWCVSCSEDATVRLWDIRVPNGAMLVMDTQHTDGVLDVCSAGSHSIATASKDNTVKVTLIK